MKPTTVPMDFIEAQVTSIEKEEYDMIVNAL